MNKATCVRLLQAVECPMDEKEIIRKQIEAAATEQELEDIHFNLRSKGGANSPQHKRAAITGVK